MEKLQIIQETDLGPKVVVHVKNVSRKDAERLRKLRGAHE